MRFKFEINKLKLGLFDFEVVHVICCLYVVDNVLLIILVYHMHDLEFNNMFKIEFNCSN